MDRFSGGEGDSALSSDAAVNGDSMEGNAVFQDGEFELGSITGGAYDWPRETKKKARFSDDGTMTFFW